MIKKKNKVNRHEQSSATLDQDLWQQFVQIVYAHIDPVLASMLKATDLLVFDKARNIVEVETLKKFVLFQDLFLQHKHVYQEYLNRIFGYQVVLVVHFTKVEPERKEIVSSSAAKAEQKTFVENVSASTIPLSSTPLSGALRSSAPSVKTPRPAPTYGNGPSRMRQSFSGNRQQRSFSKDEKALDVSDKSKWKITHILLEHLGGTVREIIKESDEFNA